MVAALIILVMALGVYCGFKQVYAAKPKNWSPDISYTNDENKN